MSKYKYFTDKELEEHIRAVERQIDADPQAAYAARQDVEFRRAQERQSSEYQRQQAATREAQRVAEYNRQQAIRAAQQKLDYIQTQVAEAAFTRWVNDPRNKARIDADPIVQHLRATDPATGRPVARTSQQPVQAAPGVINGNARYNPATHDAMVKRSSKLESIVDPETGGRRSSQPESRLGSPGIPKNGFWVL